MVITFTISDAIKDRLINAFCLKYGYTDGITKAQFAKNQMIKIIKQIVADQEAMTADAVARASVESEIILS